MKICIAQTCPVKGDIQSNIVNHLKFIETAAAHGAEIIFFPELSLTGYEPSLAKELAITLNDKRLDVFQEISNSQQIVIGAGVPMKISNGVTISMIFFQPALPRRKYAKQILHPDEYPYFVAGNRQLFLKLGGTKIAQAICYELSVPRHSEHAYKQGVVIYLASVSKTPDGVKKAIKELSAIAKRYTMTVFLSNNVGICDGLECGGRSSVWNNKGLMVGQLNDRSEGLLICDIGPSRITVKKYESII
jgi:predicted amidohydrolase